MIKNIKNAPKNPGVYFFKDKVGAILYVGKAANLRNRLKSYFDKSPKNPRFQKMLEAAKTAEWQKTDSEIEALIFESQLIKKFQPPFNIMLRDDKQYFYVGFTNDDFPKLIITHQPKLETRNWKLETNVIGPFTDGTALKSTLKLLRRIFPYCTCKQKHKNYCLNYHIGNCPGFCCLKQQKPKSKGKSQKAKLEYLKNIKAIKEILGGKRAPLIKRFEKEMNTLAERGNFEKAIELRDKIEKLKRVFENAQIVTEQRYFDISKYQSSYKKILEELKQELKLKNLPYRIEGYDASNILGEFATGAMVVFTDGRPDKNEYRKFKIRISLRQHSNILKNVRISKKPIGGGDTGMIQEVLTRRFNHPEWPYPDLIIIDGGKGQLSAAKAAMSNFKVQMPKEIMIIALTKDVKHRGDHIYMSNKEAAVPSHPCMGVRAVPLKNLPASVKNFILRVDAEAHRFAIGYYRKLHRKLLK